MRTYPADTKVCALQSRLLSLSLVVASVLSFSSTSVPRQQLSPPVTETELVQQIQSTVNRAYAAGYTRQIIRCPLPRSRASQDLGRLYEASSSSSYDNILAVPDESWQGGIMQLYRAAGPLAESVLRGVTANPAGLPPRVREDRSVDESGVDGVGLFMTECADPSEDAIAFVQPSQETIDAVRDLSGQAKDRLVMMMNPQWRDVDDALDTASKSGGIFASLAGFLGGKGGTLKTLDELNFKPTYTFEGYICKGSNIRLLKTWETEYHVFIEKDDSDEYLFVGCAGEQRPSYQDVDKMLTDKGITVRFARDIGMADKL